LFLEKRLQGAKSDLEKAQLQLSEFSSTHSTIDLKEQTRATVDAASRLESQLIVEHSGLDSLRQTYGDDNIRVRSAQARIAVLQSEIEKMSGSSKALPAEGSATASDDAASSRGDELYPPLRQLPRLAVPYANLYRQVQVQESVYELLTQQFELARIQEAKDVPVVSVIDAPGIPEKKSFPHRLTLAALFTLASIAVASVVILLQGSWQRLSVTDPRRALALEIATNLRQHLTGWLPRPEGVR
jgi:capsule polysaccharide export protein KpsE/RkpR